VVDVRLAGAVATRRRGALPVAVLVCAAYALVVMLLAAFLSMAAGLAVVEIATAIASLAAVGCLAWSGAHAHGADRWWRLLVGVTAASGFIASATNAWYATQHGNTPPNQLSLAYAAGVLAYAPALAGLLIFPSDPRASTSPGSRHGYHWYAIMAVDSVLIAGSLILLVWSTLLWPAIRSSNLDSVGLVITLASALGNLVLIAAVVLLATFRRPRSLLTIVLLGAGLASLTLSMAELLTLVGLDGQPLEPVYYRGFMVGWILIVLAALVPVPTADHRARDRPDSRMLWLHASLPYAALGAAGILALAQLATDSPIGRVELYGLFGLLLMVVLRQMMTLGENARLLTLVEQSRQALHHQAFHDPLTGVANRALFADRLQHALDRRARDRKPFALLFCDLDDFKRINDTFGHATGDELLRLTANRLDASVRAADTVARLGGDEFGVVLVGSDDPESVCRRLATTVRAPWSVAGIPEPVGISLGLVLTDPPGTRAEREIDADSLLREADAAMYAAKRRGTGGLVIRTPLQSRVAVSTTYPAPLGRPEGAVSDQHVHTR
jgi:diguanylate cyclase (GGDEF)-like protein